MTSVICPNRLPRLHFAVLAHLKHGGVCPLILKEKRRVTDDALKSTRSKACKVEIFASPSYCRQMMRAYFSLFREKRNSILPLRKRRKHKDVLKTCCIKKRSMLAAHNGTEILFNTPRNQTWALHTLTSFATHLMMWRRLAFKDIHHVDAKHPRVLTCQQHPSCRTSWSGHGTDELASGRGRRETEV